MENREVEVNVQEFNGEEYFLYETVNDNETAYDIFAKLEDPKKILIAKQIEEKDGIYYEIVEDEEYLKVINIYNKKTN